MEKDRLTTDLDKIMKNWGTDGLRSQLEEAGKWLDGLGFRIVKNLSWTYNTPDIVPKEGRRDLEDLMTVMDRECKQEYSWPEISYTEPRDRSYNRLPAVMTFRVGYVQSPRYGLREHNESNRPTGDFVKERRGKKLTEENFVAWLEELKAFRKRDELARRKADEIADADAKREAKEKAAEKKDEDQRRTANTKVAKDFVAKHEGMKVREITPWYIQLDGKGKARCHSFTCRLSLDGKRLEDVSFEHNLKGDSIEILRSL